MELEELKKSYKTSEVKYSRSELQSIFDIRTKNSIDNINKKMLIDALFMILATIILISITFFLGLRSKYIISSQIVGFSFILLLHYRLKYRLLNGMNFQKHGINQAIKKVFKIFKTYWIGYQIALPTLTILMLSKTAQYIPYLSKIDTMIYYPIVGIISFTLTTILLKSIYGVDYKRLKDIYTKMEESDGLPKV